MTTESRHLTAVMFTDIVGYSKLMAEDERRALDAVRQQRALFVRLIGSSHGTLRKEIGDGTLSTFESAVDALTCARAIQQAMGEQTAFQVRIGLHVGEIVVTDGDVYGDGVNIAARIEPYAATGGIAFSESFNAAVRGQTGVQVVSLGRQRLKNIAEPIALYTFVNDPTASEARRAHRIRLMIQAAAAVVVIGLATVIWRAGMLSVQPSVPVHSVQPRTARVLPANSIAILPFDNLSGLDADKYLSDGFSDELRDQLSRVDGLRVMARTSSVVLRGQNKTLAEIADVLRVATIVEGGLRKEGDRVRISVRLTDTASEVQLWSQSYDRRSSDMLAVQQEIALAAAQQILPQLSATDLPAPQWQTSVNDMMLLARSYQQNAVSAADQDKVVSLYQRVIQTDPQSAPAHARLGKALLLQGRDVEAAEQHMRRALNLDPNLGEGHAILGFLLWSQYRHGSGAEYKRAMELNPNDAEAAHFYGLYAGLQRQADGGDILRRARDLDPMSLWHNADLGWQSAQSGKLAQAAETAAVIEQRFPDAAGRFALSRIATTSGKLDQAIVWALQARRMNPALTEVSQDLAELLSRVGLQAESRRVQPTPSLVVLTYERRYAEIIGRMSAVDLDEADADALGYLAFALQAVGRDAEAIPLLQSMGLPDVALDDDLRRWAAVNYLATLIGALQAVGDNQQARKLAVWLEEFAARRSKDSMGLVDTGWGELRWEACALAVLGKRELALEVFEASAAAANLAFLPFMRDAGCFRELHGEPRYEAAIRSLEARHDAIRKRLPATLAKHGFALNQI